MTPRFCNRRTRWCTADTDSPVSRARSVKLMRPSPASRPTIWRSMSSTPQNLPRRPACGRNTGPGPAFRLMPPLFDGAGEDALDEVTLEGEEDHQGYDEGQERAGGQDVDVAGELPHLGLQPLGHRLGSGVGEHQGDQHVVPDPQELKDRQGGDRRAAEGEDDLDEDRPFLP